MTLGEILNKINRIVEDYGEKILDVDVWAISDPYNSCFILGNPYVSILEDGALEIIFPDTLNIDEDGD